jgi:hypothetical protein
MCCQRDLVHQVRILVANSIEFDALSGMWIAKAKHILNSTFEIFIILATGWLFLSFLSAVWQGSSYAHSYLQRAKLPSTIYIMKVARGSPRHVNDIACKSVIYYPLHEGEQLIAKCLLDVNC